MRGAPGGDEGNEGIKPVIGPLAAKSIEDLELFQKAVIDQEPWDVDPALVPLPWRTVEPSKDITVGIMWDDGIVAPHPPITRGLKQAKEKLEAAGVKVVDWEAYKHDVGWEIVSALYYPDTGVSTRTKLAKSGEPYHPLTEWALTYAVEKPLTLSELWTYHARREKYRAEHHRLMKDRGVDFILCPTYPGVAAIEGTPQYWYYTAIYNVLDLPTAIFPTGLFQDPKLDVLPAYEPRSDVEAREWKKYAEPEHYIGAPICLQLAGKHFKDEETLAAAKLISGLLGA